MELEFGPSTLKTDVFDSIRAYLGKLSIGYSAIDANRPWGGFFVIEEGHTAQFCEHFFPQLPRSAIGSAGQKLSPKILLVEPGRRLSWQYHNRRAELWRVLAGPVGIVMNNSDEQKPLNELDNGETIQFGTGVRHRLVGLTKWGVVAEIWQHTDHQNPSDESDIVRVEDDFGR